jgi:hypothetical protein
MPQEYSLVFVGPAPQKRLFVLPKCENLYPAPKGTVNTGKDIFLLEHFGVSMEGVKL